MTDCCLLVCFRPRAYKRLIAEAYAAHHEDRSDFDKVSRTLAQSKIRKVATYACTYPAELNAITQELNFRLQQAHRRAHYGFVCLTSELYRTTLQSLHTRGIAYLLETPVSVLLSELLAIEDFRYLQCAARLLKEASRCELFTQRELPFLPVLLNVCKYAYHSEAFSVQRRESERESDRETLLHCLCDVDSPFATRAERERLCEEEELRQALAAKKNKTKSHKKKSEKSKSNKSKKSNAESERHTHTHTHTGRGRESYLYSSLSSRSPSLPARSLTVEALPRDRRLLSFTGLTMLASLSGLLLANPSTWLRDHVREIVDVLVHFLSMSRAPANSATSPVSSPVNINNTNTDNMTGLLLPGEDPLCILADNEIALFLSQLPERLSQQRELSLLCAPLTVTDMSWTVLHALSASASRPVGELLLQTLTEVLCAHHVSFCSRLSLSLFAFVCATHASHGRVSLSDEMNGGVSGAYTHTQQTEHQKSEAESVSLLNVEVLLLSAVRRRLFSLSTDIHTDTQPSQRERKDDYRYVREGSESFFGEREAKVARTQDALRFLLHWTTHCYTHAHGALSSHPLLFSTHHTAHHAHTTQHSSGASASTHPQDAFVSNDTLIRCFEEALFLLVYLVKVFPLCVRVEPEAVEELVFRAVAGAPRNTHTQKQTQHRSRKRTQDTQESLSLFAALRALPGGLESEQRLRERLLSTYYSERESEERHTHTGGDAHSHSHSHSQSEKEERWLAHSADWQAIQSLDTLLCVFAVLCEHCAPLGTSFPLFLDTLTQRLLSVTADLFPFSLSHALTPLAHTRCTHQPFTLTASLQCFHTHAHFLLMIALSRCRVNHQALLMLHTQHSHTTLHTNSHTNTSDHIHSPAAQQFLDSDHKSGVLCSHTVWRYLRVFLRSVSEWESKRGAVYLALFLLAQAQPLVPAQTSTQANTQLERGSGGVTRGVWDEREDEKESERLSLSGSQRSSQKFTTSTQSQAQTQRESELDFYKRHLLSPTQHTHTTPSHPLFPRPAFSLSASAQRMHTSSVLSRGERVSAAFFPLSLEHVYALNSLVYEDILTVQRCHALSVCSWLAVQTALTDMFGVNAVLVTLPMVLSLLSQAHATLTQLLSQQRIQQNELTTRESESIRRALYQRAFVLGYLSLLARSLRLSELARLLREWVSALQTASCSTPLPVDLLFDAHSLTVTAHNPDVALSISLSLSGATAVASQLVDNPIRSLSPSSLPALRAEDIKLLNANRILQSLLVSPVFTDASKELTQVFAIEFYPFDCPQCLLPIFFSPSELLVEKKDVDAQSIASSPGRPRSVKSSHSQKRVFEPSLISTGRGSARLSSPQRSPNCNHSAGFKVGLEDAAMILPVQGRDRETEKYPALPSHVRTEAWRRSFQSTSAYLQHRVASKRLEAELREGEQFNELTALATTTDELLQRYDELESA